MLQRHGWRRLLLCAVLELAAALTGAPLRPKDIEDSLRPRTGIELQQEHRKGTDEPDPVLPERARHS